MQQPPDPYQHYPQQPLQQPPTPPMQSPIPPKKRMRRTDKIVLAVIGAVVSIFILAIIIAVASNSAALPSELNATATTNADNLTATVIANIATVSAGATAIASDLTQTAMTPTAVPTTPQPTQPPTSQSIHYPPTTVADLHGLAAKGDANAVHEFHSESVGNIGVCPQPKKEVTVDPSITGQQLAEDLLAYFYTNQLDNPCGSAVFAYHNQSEAGDAYTAGRILFDVTDSSGNTNLDPNATNLKYTLTLDTGDVATSQEYTVTY